MQDFTVLPTSRQGLVACIAPLRPPCVGSLRHTHGPPDLGRCVIAPLLGSLGTALVSEQVLAQPVSTSRLRSASGRSRCGVGSIPKPC